jgi:hypothetical protein
MVILRSIRWPRKDIKKRKFYSFYALRKIIIKSLLNIIIILFFLNYIFLNYFINFL